MNPYGRWCDAISSALQLGISGILTSRGNKLHGMSEFNSGSASAQLEHCHSQGCFRLVILGGLEQSNGPDAKQIKEGREEAAVECSIGWSSHRGDVPMEAWLVSMQVQDDCGVARMVRERVLEPHR